MHLKLLKRETELPSYAASKTSRSRVCKILKYPDVRHMIDVVTALTLVTNNKLREKDK